MNTITAISACRFGGQKPMMTRLRERGHRPGDVPMAFGTLLEVWELFPGDQQVWKFGITMLVFGGARKFFNWFGERASTPSPRADRNTKAAMLRYEMEDLDGTKSAEDLFRHLPSKKNPFEEGEE